MRLALFGPPGAGKGTQGELLSKYFGIPHLVTGQMIRQEIAHRTGFGLDVTATIADGYFAPDHRVIDWVLMRTAQPDCSGGFILDGFPRDVVQAQAWDKGGQPFNAVVELKVSDQAAINRLSGRFICPVDGESYHISLRPPIVVGRCDLHGVALVPRPDDDLKAAAKRLEIYAERTLPLRDYYSTHREFISVDAELPPENVKKEILQALAMMKQKPVGV